MNCLDKMKALLTAEDEKLLKSVYEPTVVTVPPADAGCGIMVLETGEIRIYGAINKKSQQDVGTPVYISSTDCGLSWKTKLIPGNAIGASGYNPHTGRYISVYPHETRRDLNNFINESGTWIILNDEGVDSANNRFIKISELSIHVLRKPMYFESCGRWIVLGEYRQEDNQKFVMVLISDDDGENWRVNKIEKALGKTKEAFPHEGPRWQDYVCEPTVAELSDGSFLMLVRTSTNYHHIYRSYDKGETWEGPEKSDFHSTLTMPTLQKLSDGRLVFTWCNTQPLPERNKENILPPLSDDEKSGVWEDVFTNRDANHIAISEDEGKTWMGFREIFLNTIRNNADFRSTGGADSNDKSIHQFEILELPYNKLLVHFGQNKSARKVMILDIDWIYEKSRHENFITGIGNVSTHMYIESNLGGYKGFSGHCAYNRTNGALLVRDPDMNFEEVLQIGRCEDTRLVYKKQGVVWNFPASKTGEVTVKLRVIKSGVAISLTDRWFNACDETVRTEAQFSFDYDKVNESGWDVIKIKYDSKEADIYVNGDLAKNISAADSAPNGISYLHIQTLAEKEDFEGTMIKELDKKATI